MFFKTSYMSEVMLSLAPGVHMSNKCKHNIPKVKFLPGQSPCKKDSFVFVFMLSACQIEVKWYYIFRLLADSWNLKVGLYFYMGKYFHYRRIWKKVNPVWVKWGENQISPLTMLTRNFVPSHDIPRPGTVGHLFFEYPRNSRFTYFNPLGFCCFCNIS